MVFIGRVLYHLMVCTIKLHFSLYEIMKKEVSKFKAEVAKRSRQFMELSSFCEQYLRNMQGNSSDQNLQNC